MQRNSNRILSFGFAALVLCASGASSAWSQTSDGAGVAPADAERRLVELAGRFAGEPKGLDEAESLMPEELDAASAAIEETPLGFAVGPAADDVEFTAPRGWALSTLAALGVVIALIFAARWVYTKMGGAVVARPSPVIEVLSRTPVAPKNHVLLLRVGQRVLVVGDSSSGLSTLADVTDPEEVASLLQSVSTHSERSVSKSFNSLVSRFNSDYDSKSRAELEGNDTSEIHLDRTRNSLSGLSSKLRTLGSKGGAA